MQLSHSLPVFSTCLTPLMIFGLRGLKSQLNLVRVFHFKVFCYAPVTAIYNYVCSCILYTINHFFCFICTAVFDLPKVIAGPKKHIKTKLNDSISLQCQFRAPIVVTIVVWLKDNLPVKNTQHYNIITTTNPGVDDLIVSDLNINTITSKDEGTYSCYCYYNRTMVITSKYVISNEMSATIHLGKGMQNCRQL